MLNLTVYYFLSAIAARIRGDNESGDEENADEGKDETKNDENEGVENNDSFDKDDTNEGGSPKKSFIKLKCPHCGIKTLTFRKYEIHLQERTHMIAMRRVAIRQKSIVAQMRATQRNIQNDLERNGEDLTPRTQFCPTCKLNYKQRKVVHQESEAHKNMKKFLMPHCKVCNVSFKSPMMYENHTCSIEHLKVSVMNI